MTRVLRYPVLFGISCVGAMGCAIARDLCVGAGVRGWPDVLLVATLAMVCLCASLMSCRFFVDEVGVGIGFLFRVRRFTWDELNAVGILCCNSRRAYLYGMRGRGAHDFLTLLHRAPRCGEWGFVAPMSRRLANAVVTCCPYTIDLSPIPRVRPQRLLRALWQQAALYLLMLIPGALLAAATAFAMLLRASALDTLPLVVVLTLCAFALCVTACYLLYRAAVSVTACTRISEEGVSAGGELFLRWEDVRFGYVHRFRQVSGMFLLSEPLEVIGQRGIPPIRCLSLPDTSTLLLAYLTYCPHAIKSDMRA